LLNVAAYLSGIIIQHEQIEKELWDQIHVDPLTLLPNRTLLNQRLQHAIEISSRNKTKIALLFIDVDNFKTVNDSYGHSIGDEILIRVAKAMKQAVREQDTVARTGGDEFTILLEDIENPLDASKVAQKTLDNAKKSSHLEDIEITLSTGISIYPDDTQNQEELLRNADTAMYAAKVAGKNSYAFYKPELTQAVQEQITLKNELRQALKNDEFVLYFQPIFNNTGQKIEGAETLIRWNHPTKGLVMPNNFIQAAEENGLINEITQWVMIHACTAAKQWLDSGIELKKLSINLSASEIAQDCYKKVQLLLEQTEYPASRLELEITETMLMEQGQTAIDKLEKIRQLGVSIALDDFGTGYSSLHLLRHLPVDKLKIDRSFIMELPHNQDDRTLTKLIISMGKSLSLTVVAEGVETEQQRLFLYEEGCDLLQGFLLSKSLPEEAFLEQLKLHA
jgi:diguanylate cyclase (GGDEF)-like protein